MGQRAAVAGVSENFCCSSRDKKETFRGNGFHANSQFAVLQRHLVHQKATHVAFGPVYGSDACLKRLAIAGSRSTSSSSSSSSSSAPSGAEAAQWRGSVQVLVVDEDLDGFADGPDLQDEFELLLPEGHRVTALMWMEETASKYLLIASGPDGSSASAKSSGQHMLQIASMEAAVSAVPPTAKGARRQLPWDSWKLIGICLEESTASFTHVLCNHISLVAVDCEGVCKVWHRQRQERNGKLGWQKRAAVRLHEEGISDVAVDRYFLHTVGLRGLTVCAWLIPDLAPAATITCQIPVDLAVSLPPPLPQMTTAVVLPAMYEGDPAAYRKGGDYQLDRLTAVVRPQSRWARSRVAQKTPLGAVYVAGVLAGNGAQDPMVGAGILTEWQLGQHSRCLSAQIAHESPIVSLVFGPYDNGPLITSDCRGEFRIWDINSRLQCVQQVCHGIGRCEALSLAVEPKMGGLYVVLGGDTLYVWRRGMRSFSSPQFPGSNVD
eukprot:TRINITY_DN20477_c0_g1_i1.p1 TRINITY_DN20477_c0_g1~~TRINITY_DN20477_c0_g1_i1.p1  ORF type:complete len:517 (-),score=52.98 TRINITY_DN20477_c0_g1_i1:183-1658(-)